MSLTPNQVRYYFREEAVQVKYEADANGNYIYIGTARRGASTSNSVWIIEKNTYDASNQITDTQVAVNVAWTGRASATYS